MCVVDSQRRETRIPLYVKVVSCARLTFSSVSSDKVYLKRNSRTCYVYIISMYYNSVSNLNATAEQLATVLDGNLSTV